MTKLHSMSHKSDCASGHVLVQQLAQAVVQRGPDVVLARLVLSLCGADVLDF